jgi:hypothetical protein
MIACWLYKTDTNCVVGYTCSLRGGEGRRCDICIMINAAYSSSAGAHSVVWSSSSGNMTHNSISIDAQGCSAQLIYEIERRYCFCITPLTDKRGIDGGRCWKTLRSQLKKFVCLYRGTYPGTDITICPECQNVVVWSRIE